MLDELLLEDERVIKVISDPLRQKLLMALADHGPQTSSGLSRLLGLEAAKIHYHLRKLEGAGLLELDHEQTINGIRARYLRPVARSFRVARSLLTQSVDAQDSVLAVAREQFDEAQRHLAVVFQDLAAGERPPESLLLVEHLDLSPEDAEAFSREAQALFQAYRDRRSGGERWHVVLSAVPAKSRR